MSTALRRILADGIRSVFQPVVTLAERRVIGYEALTRGPAGSALERPDLLFAAAREEGLLVELDWQCRLSAMDAALRAGLHSPALVFINIEPEAADACCPPERMPLLMRALSELRIITEITERALATNPAGMLKRLEDGRARGAGVALDDVGADWRSLALMPFIRPDVVKLDLTLVQSPRSVRSALIASAVRAYAERSGAHVLAEGIETEEHAERAIALGATLGQGWLFGRPAELEDVDVAVAPERDLVVIPQQPIGPETPVEIVQSRVPMDVARKRDLLALSHALERHAAEETEPCVVLAAFQAAEHFRPRTAQLYSRLAERSSFVCVFGAGLAPEPAPGVRGAQLPDNDRLAGEWNLLVVGPHYAGALIARDLGDRGPDLQRRFRFALVHDRELVLSAARSLMLRTSALGMSEPAHFAASLAA